MAVRTLNLATGEISPANAAVTVYTCPAGHTAILKDVRLWVSGGSALNAVLAVGAPGGLLVLLVQQQVSSNAILGLMPWVVLEPGFTLQMSSTVASSLRYALSGAELAGVA